MAGKRNTLRNSAASITPAAVIPKRNVMTMVQAKALVQAQVNTALAEKKLAGTKASSAQQRCTYAVMVDWETRQGNGDNEVPTLVELADKKNTKKMDDYMTKIMDTYFEAKPQPEIKGVATSDYAVALKLWNAHRALMRTGVTVMLLLKALDINSDSFNVTTGNWRVPATAIVEKGNLRDDNWNTVEYIQLDNTDYGVKVPVSGSKYGIKPIRASVEQFRKAQGEPRQVVSTKDKIAAAVKETLAKHGLNAQGKPIATVVPAGANNDKPSDPILTADQFAVVANEKPFVTLLAFAGQAYEMEAMDHTASFARDSFDDKQWAALVLMHQLFEKINADATAQPATKPARKGKAA